ncbi:alcohol dehydrogenase [Parapedobacter pyrenivorans]|uniref:Alcohol dehydrogenase n=1 Tax=Parapedobacter pyrenivorans TaxID=1305674 RepID=A0A917HXZ8_9SPHI|nr:alcohol dehydrogenase catalytic domain-containing protein [Parapedobacter pyrenivorans]GGG97306.1 alcohol dehydrogenase [Parapedobacter pyrenivorans]
MIVCKAAITDGKGHFGIESITVASPREDEVLVQLVAAGVCHTDYDSLHWDTPLILGHEGAGIVVKKGSHVSHVNEGDRVLLNWAIPCNHCFQCNETNYHICENASPVTGGLHGTNLGHAHAMGSRSGNQPISRSFNLGTLSEYTLVKQAAVTKITAEELPMECAAIIGCGVMTGYGSVINAGKVKPDSSVVVLGTGGVGLSVLQAARIAGAAQRIAIDINPQRLAIAERFGATTCLRADPNDKGLLAMAEKVRELTGGRGADYAFECTAKPELGAAPLAMVRNAGMAVQVSGIEQVIPFDMNLFEWDKVYINPLYGQCNPYEDFDKIIRHYLRGELLLDEMISARYTLDQLPAAFDDLLSGKNAKGIIQFKHV